ncbi:MAG: RnfABCDGE type electron transport complex subunit G [Clostridiales bacterium]|nr:RnfABCDGE type electron transport complex subunit G [Clostridiales bacterium]MCI6936579.1 RnfABCDGE type electron transport complex subunit G [Clostridiales bacterium]
MKTESNVAYIARLTITLLLITAVVAAALAAVNSVTAPKIQAINEQKTQTAIEAVLPGGGEEIAFTDDTGLVSTVYKGQSGYAVEVTPSGFNGTVTMMVGVDNAGKVLGISVVNHTETAGLGAEAASQGAAGTAFRSQFTGMSGSVSVTKDGGQVDALTGATITSRAVCTGVNAALNAVAKLG